MPDGTEEIEDVPSLNDAAGVQSVCGSATVLRNCRRPPRVMAIPVRSRLSRYRARRNISLRCGARALLQRATVTREWRLFLAEHPVLLLPVSAELPFPDGLDLEGEAGFWRVWRARLVQRGLPAMGLPGLTVSTNLIGSTPVGLEIVAGHFREDLCLLAGKAIEARGTPVAPIDPVTIPDSSPVNEPIVPHSSDQHA
jgi:amidase